jgi:TetR/AcrR family transcriptional regulator, lmrAB and yxaGH operons repressor
MTLQGETTRERLVEAMIEALATRGYHGVGLTELLQMANAPKGVLYHHFPEGKAELAIAAIDAVVEQICDGLDRLFQRDADPAVAFAAWMGAAERRLEKSRFQYGCPLATIGLESTPDDQAIRAAMAAGFVTIRERLSRALELSGVKEAKAQNTATLMVSAYEGALLQARVAGQVRPMRDTTNAVVGLLHSEVSPSRPTTRRKGV